MLGPLENNKKKKNAKWRFFTSRGAHINCAIIAMLYTHSDGNPLHNTTVVFKMRDSVPSARYPPICNVLRQWKTSLIPIYRVYRLYDNYDTIYTGLLLISLLLQVHALTNQ